MDKLTMENLEEFQEKYPTVKFGNVHVARKWSFKNYDKRKYDDTDAIQDDGWQVELPHSCDEWVIGNLEAVKEFLANLEKAVKFIEDYKDEQ